MHIKGEKLVTIRTHIDIFAAEVDKTVLDANNIKSMISADDCGGTRPGMLMGAGVRLIVREEDAARAISILNNKND